MNNSIILAVVHRKSDRMFDRTALSCHGELPYGTIHDRESFRER